MRPSLREVRFDLNERPFMVIWEVTRACDLACRHCRARAIPRPEPDELSTEEGKALLEQVTGFGRPYPLFIFSGGDPFKREDLVELVAYATELGIPASVSPSATPLLTRENLKAIRDAGAKAVSLSLDGASAESHDAFRRVPGSFEMTLKGWRAARELGLRVQINTTVTRHNLPELADIFDLVRREGAMTWSVFFLVPTGRAAVEDEVTPQDYEDVAHFLYDCGQLFPVKTTEGHHFKRVVLQRDRAAREGVEDPAAHFGLGETYRRLRARLEERLGGPVPQGPRPVRPPLNINAGKGFVFVSRRGEVFPSGFLPLRVGDVRERSLVEIYRHAPLMRDLRDPTKLKGKCGICPYREACGGSRSRAYAVHGDPLAEEPYCVYTPAPEAIEGVQTPL